MGFSREWKDGPPAIAPDVSMRFECLTWINLPHVSVLNIVHPCAAASAYDLGTSREQEYTS